MDDHAAFLAAAGALLGPRGLLQDPDLVTPWLTDWRGRYTGRALALAAPASTCEVAGLVRLCAEHRVAIVPQGGNSGMSGGATPDASGNAIVLSLRRLDAIGPVDADAGEVTCGAGVILQTLHEAADAAGLRFALTLGGKGSATVGGLISTNAGGTQVLRHGTMRAQVAGIEAVLPDGSVYSALTPLKKDNRGFDLKQLFIGAEGTLGVVTAATLRLVPAIGERTAAWVGLPSVEAARALLVRAEAALGRALEGFEIMPQSCLDAVLAHVPGARAPLAQRHAWHALVEAVSERGQPSPRGAIEDLLAAAISDGVAADAVLAANEAQADAFWRLRDEVAPAERAKGPAMQHDISVPVNRMADFITATAPLIEGEFPGTSVAAFGHLGDGNIHYHVLAPAGAAAAEWQAGEGKAISRRVHDLVTRWGGSISAEHGIGQMKRDELARLGDPVALAILGKVKAALDPLGIMNPGKLVEDRSVLAHGPASA